MQNVTTIECNLRCSIVWSGFATSGMIWGLEISYISAQAANDGYIRPVCNKSYSALIPLDSVAASWKTRTHSLSVVPALAHPLTWTWLYIPSQHLAWHLALLSLSEQFKWIIRLVMQRQWIVHLLISDQSPLSCSWCRIRLALCEMTLDSVQHCNTLWVPVKSGTSSPGRRPFTSQTADIFHILPNETQTPCLHYQCPWCRC